MNYETIVIKVPDHFQESLPADKWTYHFEVRRNYGTASRPHWQTVKYANSETEANDWIKDNSPMPVGYAENQPAINLAGIDPHLQHAFNGLTY